MAHDDESSVAKYVETTRGKKRYSASYLEKENVEMQFEASGTKREMHRWQNEKITEYKKKMVGQDLGSIKVIIEEGYL